MKPTTAQQDRCARLTVPLKALAHPTRLWILEQLRDGEQCVCRLLEGLDIDFSTLSKHLAVLKKASLINDEKRGKWSYYTLACPCVTNFLDCLEKGVCK